MTLCNTCAGFDVEVLRDQDVVMHDSLRALQQSAANGCDFCTLCWERLREHWSEKTLESCLDGKTEDGSDLPDPRILLRGEFWHVSLLSRNSGSREQTRSKIWISCGMLSPSEHEYPYITYSQTRTADLHIFAEEETPASEYFPERFTVADRNPDAHIPLIRGFLDLCHTSNEHTACRHDNQDDEMPTRVLDLGDGATGAKPRLIYTRGMREPYAALSYCWGPNVQNTTMLMDGNIETLLASLDESTLARSHQDAVQLTRSLGFRYLWIDALCIIQGNRADWEFESKRMASVYGNAELTIMAGRAAEATAGFLANNLVQPVKPVPIPFSIDGQAKTGVFATLPRTGASGPVDSRGWCFQESLLGRRVVCFGVEQLSFYCRTVSRLEDSMLKRIARGDWRQLLTVGPSTSRSEALYQWDLMVSKFSARELTQPHDVFAAISSLAQRVHRSLKCRYLAGLWECDIVFGLLWRVRYQVNAGGFEPAVRPRARWDSDGEIAGQVVTRAPSWSWASVQGSVCWRARKVDRATKKLLENDDSTVYSVRPRHGESWTIQEGCEPDLLHMPRCTLQMFGRPRRVVCSPEPFDSHSQSRKVMFPGRGSVNNSRPYDKFSGWTFNHFLALRVSNYCTVLEVADVDRESSPALWRDGKLDVVVGAGPFDFQDEERPAAVWGMRLTKEEGLILRQDDKGQFHRLGWFLVENGEWFDAREEIPVDLV